MTYYNDNDPGAAAWLRELMAAGHISPGVVDDRGIEEIDAADVLRATRVHLFAGIGGWERALDIAGWPRDVPVWTASCPCQPLSCAGKRGGEKDERHLWPELYRLVSECRPDAIFGEQTAHGDGPEWVDGISLDLEELDYAVATFDLPAASVGAPNIRQRIWWVAYSQYAERRPEHQEHRDAHRRHRPGRRGGIVGLELSNGAGLGAGRETAETAGHGYSAGATSRAAFWDRYELALRRDPRGGDPVWCRFEPGAFPLAPRIPETVALLRGSGNSINPFVAAAFVKAFMESTRITLND